VTEVTVERRCLFSVVSTVTEKDGGGVTSSWQHLSGSLEEGQTVEGLGE
jgi:hypothetical protein